MFSLPKLKYNYTDLEPHIDSRTMEIHHTKHHQAYINNLNNALENTKFINKNIEDILRNVNNLPENIKQTVINNGGGYANHLLFWDIMSPDGGGEPEGEIGEAIEKEFNNFEMFKEKFNEAATTQFGSGWAWLVLDGNKQLKVHSTPNQDSPIMDNETPILGLDVWEHAYYLNYQNKRPDYIEAWWNVVDWNRVGELFEENIE